MTPQNARNRWLFAFLKFIGLIILPLSLFVTTVLGQSRTGGLSEATYLPLSVHSAFTSKPRVNVPYFSPSIRYPETAIFWFGRVTSTDAYSDVRIGYTSQELWVNISIFDKRLWYDPTHNPSQITSYDSASLYLNPGGASSTSLPANAYRFDAQLNWWESRPPYQVAYHGGSQGWTAFSPSFTTETGWRGSAPNDDLDDRGWTVTYYIPFSTLGLSSPPPFGTTWGLALQVHNRDGASEAPLTSSWPEGMGTNRPSSWGLLSFGVPAYTPPTLTPQGTASLRYSPGGIQVTDGEVGGGTDCGDGLEPWSQWGDYPQPGSTDNSDANIQNQSDMADFPCFAKFYITFPLDSLPKGKALLSARLVLHEMGSSGGGNWGTSPRSYIQVLTVGQDWDENTLSWNNAPLAQENVSATWVDPLSSFPGWPGVPVQWDLTRAAAQAYAASQPLRLVIYSADSDYHSGKYFVTSNTGDWNAEARPTLDVEWGQP